MEENFIKYIVYITINTVNYKYYIGVHKITSYKWDHYLGCGVKDNKPSSYKNSSNLFQLAVNKYGPDKFIRRTIREFDTLEEALLLEKSIVTTDFINSNNNYNCCEGGGMPPVKCTAVHQYSLEGIYLRSFNSMLEVSKEFGVKQTTLTKVIKENKQFRGYQWSYIKVDHLNPIPKAINAPKKVGVYNTNGDLIKVYNTVRECKKDYCGCVHVLAGTRKTSKKCTFKYID